MILFYRVMSHGANTIPEMVSDYQCDCVSHGLRNLIGNELHELPIPWWMYKVNALVWKNDFQKIWGKGFTLYGLLDNYELPSEDFNFQEKIEHKFYDTIILGIHHTMADNYNTIVQIVHFLLQIGYDKKQIIVIDGWDRENVCLDILDKCLYFKREHNGQHDAIPISFAIPKDKIITQDIEKTHPFSPMIPAMHSWGYTKHLDTYRYEQEEEYYKQYQKSYFAYTCKKAGWDCLRHYEILANGCIPWFTDIERCPTTILTNFPKQMCIEAKKLPGVIPGTKIAYNPQTDSYLGDTRLIFSGAERGHLSKDFNVDQYNLLRAKLLNYTKKYLTTESLARYILSC